MPNVQGFHFYVSNRANTDASGNVTINQGYYAYGRYRSGGTLPTDRRYTGQQRDDTGLYYYSARYYDPQIGSFLSPDTIVPDPGNVQAYNRYLYTLDNPIRYNDPTGHTNFDPHHCLCGGGGATAELQERLLSELTATHEQTNIAADTAALETVTAVETQAVTNLNIAENTLASQYPQAQPAQPVQAPPAVDLGAGTTTGGQTLSSEVHSVYADGTQIFVKQQPPRFGSPQPDSDAIGAHTRLRWDTQNNRIYQGREFDDSGQPVRDIDFTNPTYPNGKMRPNHPGPPHQHDWQPNPTGGTMKRDNIAKILDD